MTARSPRSLLLALLLLVPAVALAAAPPRGKRPPRPRATHLVITETALAPGAGAAPGTVLAGVPVAAPSAAVTQKGKVKVTVIGPVEVTGTVDGAALGLRVARETPLYAPGGKTQLGKAAPGALVRVTGKGKGKGLVAVAAIAGAGGFEVRGELAEKDLTAEPGDLVLTVAWNYQTGKPADLWAGQDLKGAPILRVPEGAHLEFYEQAGDVAHVRTVGGVEIHGWTPVANLTPREAPPATAGPPRLVQPTHEAFIDAPIYADVAGKKKIGTLRGGALVEMNPRATRDAGDAAKNAGTVKVTTYGGVVVEGWVKETDLRQLSQKAISQ
jgi:hypothetical protein